MNVLIIEDHPAMVEGYMSILRGSKYGQEITFEVVKNCTDGLALIQEPNVHYDAIILDLQIPGDESKLLHDGSDLASHIKKHKPFSKLIVSTAHTDSLRLYPLYQSATPDAIMVKCDVTAAELEKALDEIYNGIPYISPTVKENFQNISSSAKYLDFYNRRIIKLLAQGVKTKNLPKHLNLSLSAIDKRKSIIKEFFNIVKGTDEDIIFAARRAGMI